MKLETKIQKLFFKMMDTLYDSAQKICKQWDKQCISLNLLKELIEKSKFKNPEKENKALAKFEIDNYRVMDSMYNACEKSAKNIGSQEVPLIILKKCIEIVKKNFTLN
jgi:hypothetical protein